MSASGRRTVAALVALVWCAALTWLVLATANPVTLNRRQILDADAVVIARIIDPAAGACRIVRQFSGDTLSDEFVIQELDKTAVQPVGDWILPLVRTGGQWEVVPGRLPSQARLVYPAKPEAIAQLEAILKP